MIRHWVSIISHHHPRSPGIVRRPLFPSSFACVILSIFHSSCSSRLIAGTRLLAARMYTPSHNSPPLHNIQRLASSALHRLLRVLMDPTKILHIMHGCKWSLCPRMRTPCAFAAMRRPCHTFKILSSPSSINFSLPHTVDNSKMYVYLFCDLSSLP